MDPAVLFYAHHLGIDLDNEKDLLKTFEKAFYDIPKKWEIFNSEGNLELFHYFFLSLISLNLYIFKYISYRI